MAVSSELTSADERSETAVRPATATHCVGRLAWASHTGVRGPTPRPVIARREQDAFAPVRSISYECGAGVSVNSTDDVARSGAAPARTALRLARCARHAVLLLRQMPVKPMRQCENAG